MPLRDVRDINALKSAMVKVAKVYIHAFFGVAANFVSGKATHHARKSPMPGLVRYTHIQVVGAKIVRHIDVGPTIIVEVARANGECPAGIREPNLFMDFTKASVSFIMEKQQPAAIARIIE